MKNDLTKISKEIALETIKLCEEVKERGKATAIVNQLLRSGTSIGANIHEATYAASKADFINKLQISLKECNETDYWLEIFHESNMITDEEYQLLFSLCSKIRKLLISSIKTSKQQKSTDA